MWLLIISNISEKYYQFYRFYRFAWNVFLRPNSGQEVTFYRIVTIAIVSVFIFLTLAKQHLPLRDKEMRVIGLFESRGVGMAFDFALDRFYDASVLSNSLTKSNEDYFYFQVLCLTTAVLISIDMCIAIADQSFHHKFHL